MKLNIDNKSEGKRTRQRKCNLKRKEEALGWICEEDEHPYATKLLDVRDRFVNLVNRLQVKNRGISNFIKNL